MTIEGPIVSPHRPKKISLTRLQSDILQWVADPVEVYPAYVCILATDRMPESSPEQVLATSDQAVRGLSQLGLISFCRWSFEHGESDQVVTLGNFCDALRTKVYWDSQSHSWKSEAGSEELILELTEKGEAYLHA